jgi:hypothetical protein
MPLLMHGVTQSVISQSKHAINMQPVMVQDAYRFLLRGVTSGQYTAGAAGNTLALDLRMNVHSNAPLCPCEFYRCVSMRPAARCMRMIEIETSWRILPWILTLTRRSQDPNTSNMLTNVFYYMCELLACRFTLLQAAKISMQRLRIAA